MHPGDQFSNICHIAQVNDTMMASAPIFASESLKGKKAHEAAPPSSLRMRVRRTDKDVGGLQVSVQDGRLAGVQVQHAARDRPHQAQQRRRIPLLDGAVMQQQVQRASRAILHHQKQLPLMLAQPSQCHDVVMRACRGNGILTHNEHLATSC